MEENVIVETIEDRVCTLTLNRPENKNALNPELMRTMPKVFQRVADNPEIGCVILTGAGDTFCAGGDKKAIASGVEAMNKAEAKADAPPKRSLTLEGRVDWLRRCCDAARILHNMKKPTIAMINGACAGAGLSLAAACDFRFGLESSIYTTAFVRMGLSGDYGGSWFLTRLVGTAKARELYFLGDRYSSKQAKEMGILNEVYPTMDELRAKTMETAKRLVQGNPATYAYIKENMNLAETQPLEPFIEHEALNMMLARRALMDAAKAAEKQKAADAAKAS
jgi:2-(1,2-epoxy-1,2-dihydrophenyl)acetyl-CoA isomerase